jgi:hypothetical protein
VGSNQGRRLKVIKPLFKLVRNEKTQAYFKWFTNSDRLTKQRLTEMMSKRYPSDEKGDKDKFSLVDTMVRHMWVFLD